MWTKAKHWFDYFLPDYFAQFFSLGAKWYEKSGIYRYRIGDQVQLKRRNIVGFGIAPVCLIRDYAKHQVTEEDIYVVEMTRDVTGDYMKWLKTGQRDLSQGRQTKVEKYLKWNIEHLFIRTTCCFWTKNMILQKGDQNAICSG